MSASAMRVARVEVASRGIEPRSHALLRQAVSLGVSGLTDASVHDIYWLEGALSDAEVDALVAKLLVDPVLQSGQWRWLEPAEVAEGAAESGGEGALVEVAKQPGVTDSEAESLRLAAHRAGFTGLRQAATGTRYRLHGAPVLGDLDEASVVARIGRGLLANEVVESVALERRLAPPLTHEEAASALDNIALVPLREASDEELLAISKERRLSLDGREMAAIRAHYRALGREPNDIELEMLAQTWSEHCVHKTFKALVRYREGDGPVEIIDSMYRTFIKAATKATGGDWLVSVFVDNAGIVRFDEDFDLAFKVETHNHPSALEPFGGANTGVGGVIRDILGVSARPIAVTDVLCFGPPDLPLDSVPAGVLHPRRIADGVIAGVADYGNKMGLPTVSGAVLYHEGYTANPLVYCGALGILPRGSHRTDPQVGDRIICLGGRTGRDGLRGATFSSMEMDVETHQIAGTAVQIGHPINEKQALEVILVARDEGLYSAITDCGAGGLSSAVGEMASELGAAVELSQVPLKYPGLAPWEIWLSEAQERMVLAVPAEKLERLAALCALHGVEWTDLGHFTGDGQLDIRYDGQPVAALDTHFLHEGMPQLELDAVWTEPTLSRPSFDCPAQLGPGLLRLLATPELRSKEDVIRGYDHEVQGGTVVKPLVGLAEAGPSDGTVLWPLDTVLAGKGTRRKGVALSVGVNPWYGLIDPYPMAWAALDEAVRNLVVVGADPDQVAVLDNFCWGNPRLPDRLAGLVRAARGCHDAAVAYGTPFISGKDSLNNEYLGADGEKHAIPGTILVSGLGIVPDVDQTVTMDLKAAGSTLYLLGVSASELGGSAWLRLHGERGARVPQPRPGAIEGYRALHRAIRQGLVAAAHDCSEGGVALAAAEMAFAGGFGLTLDLRAMAIEGEIGRDDALAFGETQGRILIEVAEAHRADFEACFAESGCALRALGQSNPSDEVVLLGRAGAPVLRCTLEQIEAAARGHLGDRKMVRTGTGEAG